MLRQQSTPPRLNAFDVMLNQALHIKAALEKPEHLSAMALLIHALTEFQRSRLHNTDTTDTSKAETVIHAYVMYHAFYKAELKDSNCRTAGKILDALLESYVSIAQHHIDEVMHINLAIAQYSTLLELYQQLVISQREQLKAASLATEKLHFHALIELYFQLISIQTNQHYAASRPFEAFNGDMDETHSVSSVEDTDSEYESDLEVIEESPTPTRRPVSPMFFRNPPTTPIDEKTLEDTIISSHYGW